MRWAARRAAARHATAIVAGSMLGIGIFIGPPQVAAHVSSPACFLALWALGGVAALCGAASVAELGAMMPRSGGDYVYLREAYGDAVAFAAGWLQILAIFPGSIAALAAASASFQLPVLFGPAAAAPLPLLGWSIPAPTVWGALIVVAFTAVNHRGILPSGRVQVALVGVPVVVLATLGLSVVLFEPWPGALGSPSPHHTDLSALAAAYVPVYFAYSGWNAALYVAGEIEAPASALPRALLGGTLAVMLLYLLLAAGLLVLFPMPELAAAGEAGTAAARKVFGAAGVPPITLLILLGILASINGTVLGGSRIASAMSRNRHFFAFAGNDHPDTGVSATALWLQAAWTVMLLATQRFEQLLLYTTSAMLITGMLTVSAVVVLRLRRPDLERPYRTTLYPWAPLLFCGSSLVTIGVLAARGDPSVLMAVGWFVAALAAHAIVRPR